MFTDFTTAEALARHRAAELQRRNDLALLRAAQGAPTSGRFVGTRRRARRSRLSPAR
jgi:hypothetical protein